MYKKIIAWVFLLAAPFMLGFFPVLFVVAHFNLQDYCVQFLGSYTLIWVTLFGCWFDGSEYQDTL